MGTPHAKSLKTSIKAVVIRVFRLVRGNSTSVSTHQSRPRYALRCPPSTRFIHAVSAPFTWALALLGTLLLASFVSAQTPGQQTVFGNLDIPLHGVTTPTPVFGGWVFNGTTRQQTDSAALYFLGDPDPTTGLRRMQYWTSGDCAPTKVVHEEYDEVTCALKPVWRGLRPDIPIAFWFMTGLSSFMGVSIVPTIPLPLGARWYTLYLMDVAYSTQQGVPAYMVQDFYLDVR